MSDDRRTARRIRLPGVQVTYEDAAGERYQARVVDLSREGLFIPSRKPIAVGKRLSLEIQPVGDLTPWSALGRIVWIREADESPERPAGMAVKIIDAEDAVLSAIEALLEAREPTERGLGTGDAILPVRPKQRSNPPGREKTMLGVGASQAAAPTAPILMAAPGREATLLGVGLSGGQGREAVLKAIAEGRAAAASAHDAEVAAREVARVGAEGREASLAIDLVTKKPASVRPPEDEPSEAAPEASPAPAAPVPASSANARPVKSMEVPTPIVAVVPADLAATAAEDESFAPPAGTRSARPEPAEDEESIKIPKSGVGKWIFLLLLLGLGGAAYVYRDQLPGYWHLVVSTVQKQLH
jgi:Tfp pilus assembly protein PilZ